MTLHCEMCWMELIILLSLGESWDDSHTCDPDPLAAVKMIGREFLLPDVANVKTCFQGNHLDIPLLVCFFICTFV